MRRRRRPARRPRLRDATGWGLSWSNPPHKYDAAAARAEMARLAYADGVSIPTIVRVLKMGRSTAYRVLEIEQEPDEPVVWTRALVLEAGQAYFRRYHQTPTSVAWNRSLARKDPEAWSRWCVGWAPVATPRQWRHWPTLRLVEFYWGGWADFRRAVLVSAPSYEPTPLPAYRERSALVTRALGHAPRTQAGNVADEIFVEAMAELEYEWRWGRRAAQRRFGHDWSGD